MGSLVDSLYSKVRQDIVECELTPGQSFSEAELGRPLSGQPNPCS